MRISNIKMIPDQGNREDKGEAILFWMAWNFPELTENTKSQIPKVQAGKKKN